MITEKLDYSQTLNYWAIDILIGFGNDSPTEYQIKFMEALLNAFCEHFLNYPSNNISSTLLP